VICGTFPRQGNSSFAEWICLDFKTLRIEPTHYTIQAGDRVVLKSWAVEGSDDGALWTEIDRCENNSDLNGRRAMKTFAFCRSRSFGRIRLLQTGPNHEANNQLVLRAVEFFGTVAGLPDDFEKSAPRRRPRSRSRGHRSTESFRTWR
jgi:hypothetical protein